MACVSTDGAAQCRSAGAPGDSLRVAAVKVRGVEVGVAVAAVHLVAGHLPGVPPLERVRERVAVAAARVGRGRAQLHAARGRDLPAAHNNSSHTWPTPLPRHHHDLADAAASRTPSCRSHALEASAPGHAACLPKAMQRYRGMGCTARCWMADRLAAKSMQFLCDLLTVLTASVVIDLPQTGPAPAPPAARGWLRSWGPGWTARPAPRRPCLSPGWQRRASLEAEAGWLCCAQRRP